MEDENTGIPKIVACIKIRLCSFKVWLLFEGYYLMNLSFYYI